MLSAPHREIPIPAEWLRRLGVALAVAALGFIAGKAALDAVPLQPLARHMSLHILLMNGLAPVIALALTVEGRLRAGLLGSASVLAAATMAQLAALWGAHVPTAMAAAMHTPIAQLAVQAVLLGTALCFWLSVLAQHGAARWRALVALLLTGKLFCLLAALLVLAPRLLYPATVHGDHAAESASALADQQLAGLLMIAACPLTYVLAAVVITARWLKEIGLDAAPALPAGRCS